VNREGKKERNETKRQRKKDNLKMKEERNDEKNNGER
jgi:hypothetical protein